MKRILHRCNAASEINAAVLSKLYDGFECDVRKGLFGQNYLRLSHDATSPGVALAYVLDKAYDFGKTVAINVKEHGLAELLAEELLVAAAPPCDYFLFDVPGVELPRYQALGLKVYGRHSLYETQVGLNGGGMLLDPFGETDDQGPVFDYYRKLASRLEGGIALISHGCHGRLGQENNLEGVSFLIGKAEELA